MSLTIEQTKEMVIQAASDKKAQQIVTLEIRDISLIADYFLICNGNSETQVQAIATEIKKKAEEHGVRVRKIEGFDAARWILIDLGDIIAHIFHRDERGYYNLERLWKDAKLEEWL
jgi:ribosome-associated protein